MVSRRIVILTYSFLILCFYAEAQRKYLLPRGVSHDQIQPGSLVFKLKKGASAYPKQALRLEDLPFKAKTISPIRYRKTQAKNATAPSVLHGIYKVAVNQDADIVALCNLMLADPDVAYAEPIYKERLLYVPNDPEAVESGGAQNYLSVIQAYDAWDITQGSEDIVIGIIDTGADLDHEDLSGNLFVNEAETINGIDDDNNGYIDDRIGYDFANNDADAESDGSGHGSQVAGLAAADTDNETGIAGLGFRSKMAPLKAFLTSTTESAGNYDAIIYAADNGYDVINLSWGSVNTFSQFNQDIIDYAVLENDVVVVAAAGNSGAEENFYPAAYDHVLAVGATTLDDTKSDFATYGNFIDVSAPGSSIYTTTNEIYGNYWGSSFAAPMVAGVAGLVRAEFPDLTAEQVMERIRVTSDDLSEANPSFVGKLGKGRLNALRALSETDLKSVRVRQLTVTGENGETIYFGDSISINMELESLLEPVNNGVFTLSDEEIQVDYFRPETVFGALATGDSLVVEEIRAIISEAADPGATIDLRVDFQDGAYIDFQQFGLTLAPDYLDLEGGQTSLTVGGNGELASVEAGTEGSGLVLGTERLASEMGLILTTSSDTVIDNAPVVLGTSKNNDFSVIQHIKPYRNSQADQYAFSIFGESDTLGVLLEQSVLSWDELDSTLVLSYRIINHSNTAIDSLGVGLFINWELDDPLANRASWDQVNSAFAFAGDSSVWAGYRVLTEGTVRHASLDLATENDNLSDVESAFTDSLKYTYLLQENPDSAGFSGGNDVATMLGATLMDFNVNETATITFLLGFGRSQVEMEERLAEAEIQFETFQANPPLALEAVSCQGDSIAITPPGGDTFHFFADLDRQDTLGTGTALMFGSLTSDTVIYVASADSTYAGALRSIHVRYSEMITSFDVSRETVYLGEADNLVRFTDASSSPARWDWDFGNGTQSTVANPAVVYNEPGTYTVTLTVQNAAGCSGTATQQIEVLFRPEPLGLSQLEVCSGDRLAIEADEGSFLRVYVGAEDTEPAFEGEVFEIAVIMNDTLVYISQVENGHESFAEAVSIDVFALQPEYTIVSALDSADLDDLWLINTTQESVSANWMINGQTYEGDTIVVPASVIQPIDLTLSVTVPNGCSNSLHEAVTLMPADLPAYEPPAVICRGDQVIVQPANGTYFGFFEADQPTETFLKGTALVYDSLTSSVDLRIFGLDGGVPGDTLAVTISPSPFAFNILATPDTLYLDQDRSVHFSLDTTVIKPQWYINETLAELVASPILSFDSAGIYQISATAEDQEGCSYTQHRDYLVFADTPIILNLGLDEVFKVYPNPTSSSVLIEGRSEILRLQIFDLKGRLVVEISEVNRPSLAWDVSSLEKGAYLLHVWFADRLITHKILKE